MSYQVNISNAITFLENVIQEQVNEEELNWIKLQRDKHRENFQVRSFYLAFTSVPRFIRKTPLQLTLAHLAEAENLRQGFQPENWNLVQCVRIYFLLMLPAEDAGNYEKVLKRLFETADIEEQVALYSSLPLLPFPDSLSQRTAEGIRTNITDVFDAIALHNPYPQDYLDQEAWNQMVLKAIFMQRPLYRIYGADERANPELARILVDFAHERWAANRKVWPELWRFVGPFLNEIYVKDIKKVVDGNNATEKEAGLLACAFSSHSEAQQLLNKYPEIKTHIENGRLTWEIIGKKCEAEII